MYRGTSLGGAIFAGLGLIIVAAIFVYVFVLAFIALALIALVWGIIWLYEAWRYPELPVLTYAEIMQRLGYARNLEAVRH